MKKGKQYSRVWFDTRSIEGIVSEFQKIVEDSGKTKFDSLSIHRGDENWSYDILEEFLSELREKADYASIRVSNPDLDLFITNRPPDIFTSTDVDIDSGSREHITRLGNVVDNFAKDCFVPPPQEPEEKAIPDITLYCKVLKLNWECLPELTNRLEKHSFKFKTFSADLEGYPLSYKFNDILSTVENVRKNGEPPQYSLSFSTTKKLDKNFSIKEYGVKS